MDELKPGQFTAAPTGASKPSNTGRYIGFGVLGLIVVAIIAGAVMSQGGKSSTYDPNWAGEAISQCEELVKDNLKAPSTAVFDTDATGNGVWTVTGTVDSENSFGAMLQADFQCTVIIEGESIKRRLDFLN